MLQCHILANIGFCHILPKNDVLLHSGKATSSHILANMFQYHILANIGFRHILPKYLLHSGKATSSHILAKYVLVSHFGKICSSVTFWQIQAFVTFCQKMMSCCILAKLHLVTFWQICSSITFWQIQAFVTFCQSTCCILAKLHLVTFWQNMFQCHIQANIAIATFWQIQDFITFCQSMMSCCILAKPHLVTFWQRFYFVIFWQRYSFVPIGGFWQQGLPFKQLLNWAQ